MSAIAMPDQRIGKMTAFTGINPAFNRGNAPEERKVLPGCVRNYAMKIPHRPAVSDGIPALIFRWPPDKVGSCEVIA
jgi:hypothetical protein